MVKQFHFDLTCDVIDDLKVNQICLSSMNFPELSIAIFGFPIKCVVSEMCQPEGLLNRPEGLFAGQRATCTGLRASFTPHSHCNNVKTTLKRCLKFIAKVPSSVSYFLH